MKLFLPANVHVFEFKVANIISPASEHIHDLHELPLGSSCSELSAAATDVPPPSDHPMNYILGSVTDNNWINGPLVGRVIGVKHDHSILTKK